MSFHIYCKGFQYYLIRSSHKPVLASHNLDAFSCRVPDFSDLLDPETAFPSVSGDPGLLAALRQLSLQTSVSPAAILDMARLAAAVAEKDEQGAHARFVRRVAIASFLLSLNKTLRILRSISSWHVFRNLEQGINWENDLWFSM